MTQTILPHIAPEGLQRARGRAEVAMRADGGRNRLERLYQQGCAKAILPRSHARLPEAVLVNTSGGITGGDRLDYVMTAGDGAGLVVTTQAAERIYRAASGVGQIETRLTLGAGAELAWLPQETIVFDGGRLRRELEVDLAPDARFVALESFVFGREAMGETVGHAFVRDRWRIRRDGVPLHGDDLRFDIADPAATAGAARLADNRAVATLVLVAPDDAETLDRLVADARGLLGETTAGASRIGEGASGKIAIRIAAPSAYLLRRRLLPVISLFLDGLPLPKVWNL